MSHRILELYSGIGGMHCAWKEAGIEGEVVAAIDINTVANQVYKYNFPKTNLITRNIQSVSIEQFRNYQADTILMSPPCQPFSRNGNFLDLKDPRTVSFLYILEILSELDSIKYILLENVKGFDCSEVRGLFISALKKCRFEYQEFLICPSQVQIPNSRLRYYCLARRTKTQWNFNRIDGIMENLPQDYGTPDSLNHLMAELVDNKYLVPDKFLKKANIFDICFRDSTRSCCFTKAYSHYIEGTGSFYTNFSKEHTDTVYEKSRQLELGSPEYVELIKSLKLRFFTPKEILSIMKFPKEYLFPDNITLKQCYRLLGNSVNVKVISELLKILFT